MTRCIVFSCLTIAVLFLAGCGDQGSTGSTAWSTSAADSRFAIVRTTNNLTQGSTPEGSLTTDGSVIYGRVQNGGQYGGGVAFTIGPDGTNYSILHNFGGTGDASYPRHDAMILTGSTLYGMVMGNDTTDLGALFTLDTKGKGYKVLHTFTGGTGDGRRPHSCPRLNPSDGKLYGMTELGGAWNTGTLFRLNTDGTSFELLHSFESATGCNSHGAVLFNGSLLYGMTLKGGASDKGVVYSYNTADGTYQVLHTFTGAPGDGASPEHCNVLLVDGRLYGTTTMGGSNNGGAIWSMLPDGSDYKLHYSFTGSSDGCCPLGSLMYDSGTAAFYGMTSGDNGKGGFSSLYCLTKTGTFSVLYDFDSSLECIDNVILLDGRLWGMARSRNNPDTNYTWIVFSYRL